MSLEGAIAVHRFGLGARPGEIEAASRDPKGWLVAQIGTAAEQPVALDGSRLPDSGTLVRQEQDMIAARRAFKAGDPDAQKKQAGTRLKIFTDEMAGRFRLGFTTARPFAEHLVWFWTNHFTVSTTAGRTLNFAGAFEREAIRPYIAGKFENMLLAVASHPAMLVYLNNVASIGPRFHGGPAHRQRPQRESGPRIDGALFAGRGWRLHPGRRDCAGQHPHRLESRSQCAFGIWLLPQPARARTAKPSRQQLTDRI